MLHQLIGINQTFHIRDIYYFFLENLSRDKKDWLVLDKYLERIPGYSSIGEDGIEKFSPGIASWIDNLCQKMVDETLLININRIPNAPFNNIYLSIHKVNALNPDEFIHEIDYGAYDFKHQGFPFTRRHFLNSVLPIVGINSNGDEDIGSCYYIGDNKFATAAHCITGLRSFNILDSKNRPLKLKEVWFMHGQDPKEYDQAIICVDEPVVLPAFEFDEPSVLDDVLVMGYPPIPGIDPILTSETASVGAFVLDHQKAAVGEVVGEAGTYFHDLDYFLINARVKGGNSGGPVINSYGKVIGTVVEIPLDSLGGMGTGRFDVMGYGICLPSKYLRKLMMTCDVQPLTLNEDSYVTPTNKS